MKQYLELVDNVLKNGHLRPDRTGVGTISTFGHTMRFSLMDGFPLCTTKKVHFRSVIRELIWLISGSTNVNDLHPCKIWDEWADEDGELGPVYGAQWRDFGGRRGSYSDVGNLVHLERTHNGGVDQLANVIEQLRTNPFSRRHIVCAWNAYEAPFMALPPCHAMFQFFVHEVDGKKYLSCQLYQRSADIALGVPFNIASYAALTHMIAQQVDMIPFEFIHTLGDTHAYSNHLDGLREQLKRPLMDLPTLILKNPGSIDAYKLDDFELINYVHAPAIKFAIAV